MHDNYKPPQHDLILIDDDGIIFVGYHSGEDIVLSPDEAITLGIRLMENGLYFKKQGK